MTVESLGGRTYPTGQMCIVTSSYYPESTGGEETFISQYSRFLKARAIPFKIVSASSAKNGRVERVNIRPFSIPLAHFEVRNLLWSCFAALKIVKLHSEERIGLIYSIDTGHAGLAGVFASRVLRCRLIVHSHGRRSETWREILRSEGDWKSWPYWALQRFIDGFVVHRASKIIAVSSEVISFLESFGVPEKRILLAPSAIEINTFFKRAGNSLREDLGLRRRSFVIGYLGRLAHLKGLEVLLVAFAKFSAKSSGESFVLIAGDGPLRDNLEAQASEMGLRNVRFLGARSDTVAFLIALDVFVLPSFSEGSPISLLEAMASGCAIIASDIQGVREVAGDSTLLFPPGDSTRLAELLVRLKADSALRRRLSKTALEQSRSYSTTVVFPRIWNFCVDP